MKTLIIIFLSLISYSGYAQFFGYQGKRLEITAGVAIMPNPAITNPMRYGENNDTPSGFALPYSPFAEFNFAVSRRIGVGFKVWYANNFVGYRVPGVNGGYNTMNNVPQDLILDERIESFNFYNNHNIKTYYTGITLRYYTRSFIAPAGNYFEIGYGKVNVIEDLNDTYEYKANKLYYSEDGNAIPNTATSYTIESIDRPKIDPVGLLSFGYFVRKETKLLKNLMYDVGATFSFGFGGGRPESVENPNPMGNSYNVQVNNANSEGSSAEDELDELIKGTSYVFIRKQNFFRFSTKLIYLF
ncbi:MAG: hypothetical protein COB15_01550 [Flavobacteriales bacterium]|nr:MAG: hypothetical protein COB15_01550 [Flavobacteriales bacterium]